MQHEQAELRASDACTLLPVPCSPSLFPLSAACSPAQQWNYIRNVNRVYFFRVLHQMAFKSTASHCASSPLSFSLSLSAAKHVWMAIVYRLSPIVICALWHLLMYCLWSASPCLPALLDGMIDVCVLCLAQATPFPSSTHCVQLAVSDSCDHNGLIKGYHWDRHTAHCSCSRQSKHSEPQSKPQTSQLVADWVKQKGRWQTFGGKGI